MPSASLVIERSLVSVESPNTNVDAIERTERSRKKRQAVFPIDMLTSTGMLTNLFLRKGRPGRLERSCGQDVLRLEEEAAGGYANQPAKMAREMALISEARAGSDPGQRMPFA